MNNVLKNVKGTKDFMPKEQRVRNNIINTLQHVFELYGYQPLETPTLCYFDLLSSKYAGGAEILKEVYHLEDQGERQLGLRYDLTVPFAKVIGMNPNLKMPFKRYEIGKVFRDGPVKTGRMREFIQCDVDMVGVKSMMAEAEIMIMASEIFEQIGLDVYISYNNRKLLSGILLDSKIEEEKINEVILSLDKLEKIGTEGVRKELKEKAIEIEKIERIFNVLTMDVDGLLDYFKDKQMDPLIKEGIEELQELNRYIEMMGIKDKVRFNPSLARGLEIYTGTVYEIFLKDGMITSSIGAGGRYDKIIGGFLENGQDYPAVGITFGLDVIYAALMMKKNDISLPPVDVFIIPLGVKKEALKVATDLRRKGIKVDVEMMDRKLKKSLDYANKQHIPYVIIMGEEELKKGTIKIKDMFSSEENEIKVDEIPSYLVVK